MAENEPKTQHCTTCDKTKPLDAEHFVQQKNGLSRTCIICTEKRKKARATRKETQEQENRTTSTPDNGAGQSVDEDLEIVTLPAFIDSLERAAQTAEVREMSAKVALSSFPPGDHKSHAGHISRIVWDCLGYRYTSVYDPKLNISGTYLTGNDRYKNDYDGTTYGSTRFIYHCCQNEEMQRKSKKSNDPEVKNRDRERMDVYDCGGLLHVNVLPHLGYVAVRVVHRVQHDEYIDISLPQEVKTFIETNVHLTTTMLWDEILKTNPTPSFSRNLVRSEPVAQVAVPHLRLHFQGKPVNKPPTAPEGRRCILKVNGVTQSDFYISPTPGATADDDDGQDDEVDVRLEAFADDADEDRIDGKPWEFEKGEELSKNALYVFCPAPHRKQLLLIFAKHFCQHPFFLERRETERLSSKQIRDNAVWEMYNFCKQRGLREVWGYFWANWYSPQRWVLWARSSSPDFLTISRTTMGTENFWRQLKHNFLHNVNRPRIDHLIYIILTKVCPTYYARISALAKERAGRPGPLTSRQQYFKASWKKLADRELNPTNSYFTDVPTWRCNCGSQKYNPHALCKHLVQAVGPVPIAFWRQVKRHRTEPIYTHAILQPPSLTASPPILPMTTEPQSNHEAADSNALSNGAVRRANKRPAPQPQTASDVDSGDELRGDKRAKHGTPADENPFVADECDAEEGMADEGEDLGRDTDASSSVLGYGSEDEFTTDDLREELRDNADIFEEAVRILRHGADTAERMWLNRALTVGKDLKQLAEDVVTFEKVETTGQRKAKTWGKDGSKGDKRRAQNTMGYHRRTPDEASRAQTSKP